MSSENTSIKKLKEQWHNDPKNWKYGLFYFNKDDKRIFSPKRNKYLGWTVNFANATSIITFLVLITLILLVTYFLTNL